MPTTAASSDLAERPSGSPACSSPRSPSWPASCRSCSTTVAAACTTCSLGRWSSRLRAQLAEDPGLLGLKLRVVEHPLRLQLAQLLELVDAARAAGGGRSRRGRGLLLWVRSLLLRRPPFRLATADAIRYGGGGARHSGGAGHPAKQTWHDNFPFVQDAASAVSSASMSSCTPIL